jgi:hypothetical protein
VSLDKIGLGYGDPDLLLILAWLCVLVRQVPICAAHQRQALLINVDAVGRGVVEDDYE